MKELVFSQMLAIKLIQNILRQCGRIKIETMPACIFLFPNALNSEEQARSLGSELVPACLKEFLEGTQKCACSTIFDSKELDGLATTQWLWMTLSSRDNLVPVAPYLWKGLGGMKTSREIWSIDPYKLEDNVLKVSKPETFDIDQECELRDLLTPICRPFGFEIQVAEGRFFLTRKGPWQVMIAPWLCQEGKAAARPLGPDSGEWIKLSESIFEALKSASINTLRKEAGQDEIDGFWISSGGREEQLLPYTQIRCIVGADTLLKGIGEAAGINPSYLTAFKTTWPNCAEGGRLVLLDDFLDPEIKTNPALWTQTWDKAIEKCKLLLNSAEGFEPYFPRLVATDGTRVSIIEKKKSSSGFSFFNKPKDLCGCWLTGITK